MKCCANSRRSFFVGRVLTRGAAPAKAAARFIMISISLVAGAACLFAPAAANNGNSTASQSPALTAVVMVDTALILAVDTSRSVDDERFRLQMDGIASALSDRAVINTILGGPRGAVAIMLVAWADHSKLLIPWTIIRTPSNALTVADRISRLNRSGGEYTCLARMFRGLNETVLGDLPFQALKVVVDVSGDGIDNCESEASVVAARDGVVASGAVINGLPILVDRDSFVGQGAYRAPGAGLALLTPPDQRERLTLDRWYEKRVIGGFGAFSIPADGYGDFARAMRSKFIVEISMTLDNRQAAVDSLPASPDKTVVYP